MCSDNEENSTIRNMKLKCNIPFKRGHSYMRSHCDKKELIIQLLALKDNSGLSFDKIAKKLGYTNIYTAQLCLLQSPIKSSEKASILRDLLTRNGGNFTDDLLQDMQRNPLRSYDDETLEDPTISNILETLKYNGEAIKMVINEKFGDGTISQDMNIKLDKIKQTNGNSRIKITIESDFIPFKEQLDISNEQIDNE